MPDMYIKVRVIAGSRIEKITKVNDNSFTVSVKEKAERGLANKRILQIIADIFQTKNVRIINGHHSPSKLLAVGD
jgi:uncharacterized protein YggU (UPF0235/DUF167 family)